MRRNEKRTTRDLVLSLGQDRGIQEGCRAGTVRPALWGDGTGLASRKTHQKPKGFRGGGLGAMGARRDEKWR